MKPRDDSGSDWEKDAAQAGDDDDADDDGEDEEMKPRDDSGSDWEKDAAQAGDDDVAPGLREVAGNAVDSEDFSHDLEEHEEQEDGQANGKDNEFWVLNAMQRKGNSSWDGDPDDDALLWREKMRRGEKVDTSRWG